MSHSSEDMADQSISSLVGEIVTDAQKLMKQHLELLRVEVREDIRKSRRAALVMASAHVLALVGCASVAAMLVGLLTWAAPGVAWWCWCGIIGGATLMMSAVVYGGGKRLLATLNLLPDQSVRALKESLQCQRN